jgi:hypothetical protein
MRATPCSICKKSKKKSLDAARNGCLALARSARAELTNGSTDTRAPAA